MRTTRRFSTTPHSRDGRLPISTGTASSRYNPDTQDKGVAEIIIGKQRNGPIGTVRLTFLGEYTRFENFAQPGSY